MRYEDWVASQIMGRPDPPMPPMGHDLSIGATINGATGAGQQSVNIPPASLASRPDPWQTPDIEPRRLAIIKQEMAKGKSAADAIAESIRLIPLQPGPTREAAALQRLSAQFSTLDAGLKAPSQTQSIMAQPPGAAAAQLPGPAASRTPVAAPEPAAPFDAFRTMRNMAPLDYDTGGPPASVVGASEGPSLDRWGQNVGRFFANEGPMRFMRGLEGMADPSTKGMTGVQALNDVVGGGMLTAAPVVLPYAASATGASFIPKMAGGALMGYGAAQGLEAAGVAPEIGEFVSNLVDPEHIGGAILGGKGLSMAMLGSLKPGGAKTLKSFVKTFGNEKAQDLMAQGGFYLDQDGKLVASVSDREYQTGRGGSGERRATFKEFLTWLSEEKPQTYDADFQETIKAAQIWADPKKGDPFTSRISHVTTPENAAAIRREGYKVGAGKGIGGGHYGPAVYMSDEASDFGSYWHEQLRTRDFEGEVPTQGLGGQVTLKNPAIIETLSRNGTRLLKPREIVQESLPKHLEKFDTLVKDGLSENEAIGQIVREAGHDGMVLKRRAGDEIVAFDPSSVAFDKREVPDIRISDGKYYLVEKDTGEWGDEGYATWKEATTAAHAATGAETRLWQISDADGRHIEKGFATRQEAEHFAENEVGVKYKIEREPLVERYFPEDDLDYVASGSARVYADLSNEELGHALDLHMDQGWLDRMDLDKKSADRNRAMLRDEIARRGQKTPTGTAFKERPGSGERPYGTMSDLALERQIKDYANNAKREEMGWTVRHAEEQIRQLRMEQRFRMQDRDIVVGDVSDTAPTMKQIGSGSTIAELAGAGSAPGAASGGASLADVTLGAVKDVDTPAVQPATLQRGLKGEEGYVYHATNADRLRDIADTGRLKTFRPSHGTDQRNWPDLSTDRRAYFGASPENLWQFAPEEGTPVVVRAKTGAHISKESGTGDLFASKPIASKDLEYLGDDGQWHPVTALKRGSDEGGGTPPPAAPVSSGLGPTGGGGASLAEMAGDYRGQHTAPQRDAGAPLHDLTGGGTIYPDDVYGAKGQQYYGDRSEHDAATFRLINYMKGKPDAPVTIFRAVPNDAPDVIHPGDWVTINRGYAQSHGEGPLGDDFKIISKQVKASDIFTNGDSIHEWGYSPNAPAKSLASTGGVPSASKSFDDIGSLAEFEALARAGRLHQAEGKTTAAEEAAYKDKSSTPISFGELAGYSNADIAHFYINRRGGRADLGAYEFVKSLHREGRPIPAGLWTDVVTEPVPHGYVREGNVFVPKGSKASTVGVPISAMRSGATLAQMAAPPTEGATGAGRSLAEVAKGETPTGSALWLPPGVGTVPEVTGAPSIISRGLPKPRGSLAQTITRDKKTGLYSLKTDVQDRLHHFFELGAGIPANWDGSKEQLLAAFGGDENAVRQWWQAWGALSPNTSVVRNTQEDAAAQLWRLEHQGQPLPVEAAQGFGPDAMDPVITSAPSKVPNVNNAWNDRELSGVKVQAMGGFMQGQDRYPIDVHVLFGVGSKSDKLNSEMPALKALMVKLEKRPLKGKKGTIKEPEAYLNYEDALRRTYHQFGATDVSHQAVFGQGWEGIRAYKGLKPQGGPIDMLRAKGLLEQGAMLDPKKLKEALQEAGWAAPAILAVLSAIYLGDSGRDAASALPETPSATAPAPGSRTGGMSPG